MFEILYSSTFAINRHRAGMLTVERERYLRHCADQGGTFRTQRQRAGVLLWLAERMQPADLDGMDATRLQELIHTDPAPSNEYAERAG